MTPSQRALQQTGLPLLVMLYLLSCLSLKQSRGQIPATTT